MSFGTYVVVSIVSGKMYLHWHNPATPINSVVAVVITLYIEMTSHFISAGFCIGCILFDEIHFKGTRN